MGKNKICSVNDWESSILKIDITTHFQEAPWMSHCSKTHLNKIDMVSNHKTQDSSLNKHGEVTQF